MVPTLADCQVAQTQAGSREANLAREVETKEKSGTSVARSVNRFACVPLGWRPGRVGPGGLCKSLARCKAEESTTESAPRAQSPI
jgi:hypothetical protein